MDNSKGTILKVAQKNGKHQNHPKTTTLITHFNVSHYFTKLYILTSLQASLFAFVLSSVKLFLS